MANHTVELKANAGIFLGLAKQNMLFHQCIQELCDNAIASAKSSNKPLIDIFLNPLPDDPSFVNVWICDNGSGMNLEQLKKALQLGESPTSNSRLNEHGFGLKNSLATLSGGNRKWTLWTKDTNNTTYKVEGPFSSEMTIQDSIPFPNEQFLPSDVSTIINVKVSLSFIQTVQGRGARSTNLSALRMWLIEHLGVAYRGYLDFDIETQDTFARIKVSIQNDSLVVPPINVPIGNSTTKYITLTLAGHPDPIEIIYRYGTLDETLRDRLLYNREKAKYYYQKNIPTQGIDIRLGKRVIATRQLETIWKAQNSNIPLSRHNNFNDFVGEVIIPELPRGILTTVNNKTDFNLDDSNWTMIFDALNEIRPVEKVREKSEATLKSKWIQMLKATNPYDTISDEIAVWPAATKIDVYRKSSIDDSIIIYEIKVGQGTPIHLYQLKMYWDGLIMQGEQPKEAVLLVEDYTSALEAMANSMNQMTPPEINGTPSYPYNFKLEKHRDTELT